MAQTSQSQIGWCVEHKPAQHAGDAADLGLIGGIASGIPGAEFCDLTLGASLADEEIAPVRQRQEVLRTGGGGSQALLVPVPIADGLGLQQAPGVCPSG